MKIGNMSMQRNLIRNPKWDAPQLERGESITIITNFVKSDALPAQADIAIAVDYNPWGVPFKKFRSVTRFVGHFGDSGWQWLKQANRPIRDDLDASVADWQKNA